MALSNFDGSMWGTQVPAGTPRIAVPTFVHVLPPSRVSCTLPSSVPTQSTPRFTGLGAIWMIVVKNSAPDTS